MSARNRSPFDPYQVTESGLYLRDNTTADVSTSRHGLTPKLDGNSAHFLNGAGGWSTPPGTGTGAMVFLERHAASSSSSLDFTTFISATYDKYLLVGESLVLQTSTAHLYLEIGTGGGPSYDTGNNYEWGGPGFTTGGTSGNFNGTTGPSQVFSSVGTTAGWAGSFALHASALQSTSLRKTFHGTLHYINSTPVSIARGIVIQWTTTGTAVTAVRFIPSSGNIVSGSITIYGLTNS